MPGTAVLMALVSPPLAVPGLGLKVSNWLGPPCIHNKMQAMPRLRNCAACAVTRSVQLSTPPASAAVEMVFRKSRRPATPSRVTFRPRQW